MDAGIKMTTKRDDQKPKRPLLLENRRIPQLKRTTIKRLSPAEREALAAFKAGKMKPLVRKPFPKEVVEERLGQFADYMIARIPKKDRSRISREWLIAWLRPMFAPPEPLQDVTLHGGRR